MHFQQSEFSRPVEKQCPLSDSILTPWVWDIRYQNYLPALIAETRVKVARRGKRKIDKIQKDCH
jgi:hypothetical protein